MLFQEILSCLRVGCPRMLAISLFPLGAFLSRMGWWDFGLPFRSHRLLHPPSDVLRRVFDVFPKTPPPQHKASTPKIFDACPEPFRHGTTIATVAIRAYLEVPPRSHSCDLTAHKRRQDGSCTRRPRMANRPCGFGNPCCPLARSSRCRFEHVVEAIHDAYIRETTPRMESPGRRRRGRRRGCAGHDVVEGVGRERRVQGRTPGYRTGTAQRTPGLSSRFRSAVCEIRQKYVQNRRHYCGLLGRYCGGTGRREVEVPSEANPVSRPYR